MTVQKTGYLYVYVSNESNMDVFFDDLVINHKTGALLEVTNYYPQPWFVAYEPFFAAPYFALIPINFRQQSCKL
jgi:hypothetical protein